MYKAIRQCMLQVDGVTFILHMKWNKFQLMHTIENNIVTDYIPYGRHLPNSLFVDFDLLTKLGDL